MQFQLSREGGWQGGQIRRQAPTGQQSPMRRAPGTASGHWHGL